MRVTMRVMRGRVRGMRVMRGRVRARVQAMRVTMQAMKNEK